MLCGNRRAAPGAGNPRNARDPLLPLQLRRLPHHHDNHVHNQAEATIMYMHNWAGATIMYLYKQAEAATSNWQTKQTIASK